MAQLDTDTAIAKKVEINNKVQPPKMYKVIYINDDITSVQFVVETLATIFAYTAEAAEEMAIKIHNSGSAVVAVFPYEIAEQKGVEVTVMARNNGYPLQIKLEPEA